MKPNTAVIFELDKTIEDLEDLLKPKTSTLPENNSSLQESLDDLESYINPGKTSRTSRVALNKKPNRIDLALKKIQQAKATKIKQNKDIEVIDFQDTDIPYFGFT